MISVWLRGTCWTPEGTAAGDAWPTAAGELAADCPVVAGADPPGAGVLVGRTTSWLLPPPHAARRLAPAAALAATRNSRRCRRRVVMVSILPGTHGTHNPQASHA